MLLSYWKYQARKIVTVILIENTSHLLKFIINKSTVNENSASIQSTVEILYFQKTLFGVNQITLFKKGLFESHVLVLYREPNSWEDMMVNWMQKVSRAAEFTFIKASMKKCGLTNASI